MEKPPTLVREGCRVKDTYVLDPKMYTSSLKPGMTSTSTLTAGSIMQKKSATQS